MTPALRAIAAALLVLSAAVFTAASAATVELVESSDAGITVRCGFEAPVLRDDDVGDGGYTSVAVPGASRIGIQGSPELPVVTLRLAVPFCETVELSYDASLGGTFEGVTVVPSPTTVVRGDTDIPVTEYVEGPTYGESGAWPADAARLYGLSVLGRQRVAVIEVYPCQADVSDETLLWHGSVTVRLTFAGFKPGDPVRAEHPRRESLLSSLLLNYEEGKDWRMRPSGVAAAREGDYFTSSGNWARLSIRERGIYGVTYEDMLALESDPSLIDPQTFRALSGGGLPVPASLAEPRPDWIEECAVYVDGGDDGTFDPGDAVVFYGLGVDAWVDELEVDAGAEPYYENRFANDNVYWLTWEALGTPSGFENDPLRMVVEDAVTPPSPVDVDDYRAREHFEQNVNEYQGIGDNWFWYEMDDAGDAEERYFHEQLDHVVTDSSGTMRAYVRGNSSEPQVNPDHYVVFYLNGVEALVGEWDGYATFLAEASGLPVAEGYNTFKIYVPRDGAVYEGERVLIDWLEIEYWRELWTSSDQLAFGSSGRTGALRYSVEGFEDDDLIGFRIADKYTASVLPSVELVDGNAVFVDDVADTASYVVTSRSGYLTPYAMTGASPGELRTPDGSDYIMIAYDDFYDEAGRLAGMRESEAGGGYDVRLVTTSEVYDEFSWGLVDPAAIRDFLKYTYDNELVPPTHVLLVGDATSDYRQYLPSSAQTFVPTYYTGGSQYWPTDQWFVGFTAGSFYEPAMALGRLPVGSTSELRGVVDKIIRYETESELGPWKNTVILIADDEFKFTETPADCCEFFHVAQADSLSWAILPWPLDRKKIYLMEYERDLAGHKTEARNDVIDEWNEGALIVNWTGHGNETLMAHEYIFLYDDVARLTNTDGLPLYFGASCRLNKFDMPATDSLGEMLVQSSSGGSIASIGSTRDSGATQNSRLNGWFYSYLFGHQRTEPRTFMDIGSAFQAAFMEGSSWHNNTKFCIMGDPATDLAAPSGGGSFETAGLEPMRRRDTISLAGENDGQSEGESGVALVFVSESADTSGYLHTYPLPQRQVDYTLPGQPVFEGATAVAGGELDAEFVVSALAEEGPYGRIRAYFYGDDVDGAFSVEDVAISDSVDVQDAVGPDIELGFEGGSTSVLPGATLRIVLSDESGINLVDRTGSDGIVLAMDGGEETQALTEQFAYDLDSHERGSVELELPSLSNGSHNVAVSASDNMGNRSTEVLNFEIVSSTEFTIRNVANHPNPFPDGNGGGTTMLFQLPVAADVSIQIFTVGGRLIRVLDDIAADAGSNQVYWDGLDQEGDELANGVYLYRIHAVSRVYRGDKAEAIGRAVVMR